MTEKKITTRIVLTHDEYTNLASKTLKEGEVILAKVGTTHAPGEVVQPVWMMKIGDGTSTVENCPWLVAPAADVYDWAKKSSLDANDLPAIPGAKLGITVTVTGNGNAITDSSWDADTKTLTLTKGETFLKASEFVDTTYSAGTKLDLDGTTFNHESTTRTDTTTEGNAEFGKTIEVIDSVTSDETGHITAVNKKTITLPTPEEVSLPTVDDTEVTGEVVVEVDQTAGAIDVKRKAIDLNYDNATRKIQLKVGADLIGQGFDASEFVKDGMIKSVELVDVDDENNTGKFLKITWNTPELDDADTITYVDLTTLIDVYEAGDGISIEGKNISHADTSSVANVTKTDRTYISGIEFDEFGHVTKVETGVEEDQDLTHNHDDVYSKLNHTHTVADITDYDADVKARIKGETDARTEAVEDLQGQINNVKSTADTALQSITTTANGGLKVTGTNQIDIDDNIVFVLDGGTAADLT
jgi:hypothetical protein